MNSLHIISSLKRSSGGTSTSSYTLVKGLQKEKLATDMVTFKPGDIREEMISTESFIHLIPTPKIRKWHYSRPAIKFIKEKISQYDLFHIHGIWEFLPNMAARYAGNSGLPYIITISGMLYPSALAINAKFKKLASMLFQYENLRRATVIHATCYQEYEYIRQYGLKNPVAVIANPLELPQNLPAISPSEDSKVKIGFMGRFNPIKNIDVLIEAWAKINKSNPTKELELILIGDGEKSYRETLQKQVKKHGLTNVSFTGFLNGPEREAKLATLNYLVLPSKSENFGMVVTEALLYGVPVIASKGTPWGDLDEYKCGWWVDNDVDTLSSTIGKAIHLDEKERIEMGKRGQALVENKYSQSAVALQTKELYAWMLDRSLALPSTVYLN